MMAICLPHAAVCSWVSLESEVCKRDHVLKSRERMMA